MFATEKHKTYHIKDEQLARDGFKKFLKNEPCQFERCRFSLQCNHIHCVRDNCYYVLHSSGQLLSHKRKHERIDTEQAYQQFKLTHKGNDGDGEMTSTLSPSSSTSSLAASSSSAFKNSTSLTSYLAGLNHNSSTTFKSDTTSNETLELLQQIELQKQALLQRSIAEAEERNAENSLADAQKILYETEQKRIQQLNAALLFAQNNFNGDQIEPLNLHLKQKEPLSTSLAVAVSTIPMQNNRTTNLQQITSIDGLFNRKRGRPPKNRVVEVYQNVSGEYYHFFYYYFVFVFHFVKSTNIISSNHNHKIQVLKQFLPVLNWKKMVVLLHWKHYQIMMKSHPMQIQKRAQQMIYKYHKICH